jgi:hypothetical protein
MAEPHVVTALRAKRAEISGHVHDLERKLARHRANLANIDATVRLFAPELNPDTIPPKLAVIRTPEIEITPEMIEAGAKVLMDHSGLIDLSPTFAEIYSEQVLRAALRLSSGGKFLTGSK